MDVTSVSLAEVLAASSARAASLVPETSGYLALAVADASARLPYALDDALVSLTTEGTVKVARGSLIVPPEESAGRMRDVLARLLAQSIGSAPALAAASRPRREAPEGVDGFIRELEAALVPVNRAAARRALARLARETVRAKETGKLRRRRSRRPEAAPLPPPAPAAAAAPATAAAPEPEDLGAIDVEFSAPPPPAPPAEVAPQPVEPQEPAPEPTALRVAAATPPDEGATTVDAPVAPIDGDAADPSDALARVFSGTAKRSSVDDLLDRFAVSQLTTPDGMVQARASLKRLAGLDPTPPPPTAEELRKFTQRPPNVAPPGSPPEPRTVRLTRVQREPAPGSRSWGMIALIALGLALAGLLGHYVPKWLSEPSASHTPGRA